MECRFCGAEILDGVVECPVCKRSLVEILQERICPGCGEKVASDAKYCPKCGKEQRETSMLIDAERICSCPKCGAIVEREARFCLKCGYAFGQGKIKKKQKRRIFLLIGIIVVLALGVGFSVYHYQKEKKIQQEQREQEQWEQEQREQELLEHERERQELILSYKRKAEELNSAISDAVSNFDMLSRIFATTVNMPADYMGPEFYTRYAEALCSAQLSEERTRRNDIDKINSELLAIKCEEAEVEELKKAMEEVYNAYVERYKVLIEHDFSTISFERKDADTKKAFNESLTQSRNIINNLNIEKKKQESEGDTI